MHTNTLMHNLIQTTTHARHVASKVAADLKRVQRIFQTGHPSNSDIDAYQQEMAMLLDNGYLGTVIYGFKQNDRWIFALKYHAMTAELVGDSNHSGEICTDENIPDINFISFLSYSSFWNSLSDEERESIKATLPFQRFASSEPDIENGYWAEGRRYSSGDIGVRRFLIERA